MKKQFDEYELKIIEWLKTFKNREELKSLKVYHTFLNNYKYLLDTALPKNDWTLEICKQDALKYKNKKEWEINSGGYIAARRKGWLDVCCSHMKLLHSPYTLENCKKDAQKYKTRGDWARNSESIYVSARTKGWLEICCGHMGKKLNGKKAIKCSNGKVYEGQKCAAKYLGLSEGNISSVLNGKRKSTGGYTFVYVEEENDGN
jgi:hypothetical protein